MQDLLREIEEKFEHAYGMVDDLLESGCQLASNERDYRVALRARKLHYRSQGMAVGLIDDASKGDEDIAELRFKRDCSEAVYKACSESINLDKLRIRVLDKQVDREWSRSE